MVRSRQPRRKEHPVWLTFVLAAAGVGVAFYLYILIRTFMGVHLDGNAAQGDCLIVFCHFLTKEGAVGAEFGERLRKAAELLKKFPRLTVIINGGQTLGTPVAQAAAAFNYLEEQGISRERMRGKDAGHDTLDEVRFAQSIMKARGWEKPIVISNFLQLMQIDTAFIRLGTYCIPVETRRQDRTWKQLIVRLIVIPLTWIDPLGNGPVFKLIRRSRESKLGSKI